MVCGHCISVLKCTCAKTAQTYIIRMTNSITHATDLSASRKAYTAPKTLSLATRVMQSEMAKN